jgi:hypothetical protein
MVRASRSAIPSPARGERAHVRGTAADTDDADEHDAQRDDRVDERERLREHRDTLADQLHSAPTQLSDARRQAERDSQAVTAARRRLDDGRRARCARSPLSGASTSGATPWPKRSPSTASTHQKGRARCSTAALLSSSPGSPINRFTDARLDDSYLLHIADERQLHPLRRFSGGEQDLASLCLRLALSRTLAEQRGVEAAS